MGGKFNLRPQALIKLPPGIQAIVVIEYFGGCFIFVILGTTCQRGGGPVIFLHGHLGGFT